MSTLALSRYMDLTEEAKEKALGSTETPFLEGDELSKRGDEERAVVRNRDADLDAQKYGYKSWKALKEDFKEQKK